MKTYKDFFANKTYVILGIITFLTALFMLITFDYCDLSSLTVWSVNIWDLIFCEGGLSEFYAYAEENIRGAWHANCVGHYMWIIPWAIWNFPIWLAHHLSGELVVTGFWSLCWSKLFLFILAVVMARICTKICAMFTQNKKVLILVYILILASPELLLSIGYAGQDEILYLTCFVIALYYFLCDEKWKFYVWAVLAVTYCTIMLIPILVLVLIREKNIVKIGLLTVGTMIPTIGFEILYRNDQIYHSVKTDFSLMVSGMFDTSSIVTVFGSGSVLGVFIIILFFYCYCIKWTGGEKKTVLYILAVAFTVMSLLMNDNFYRLFLYIPFLVMMIAVSEQNLNVNLLLFTIMTWGRMVLALKVNSYWNMSTYFVMKDSWVTKLCDMRGNSAYLKRNGLYDKIIETIPMLQHLESMLISVVVASTGLLLVINHEKWKNIIRVDINEKAWVVCYVLCMPFFLGIFYSMLF